MSSIFTISDWEDSCRRYDRNREGMGFSVDVTKGKTIINGLDDTYATAVSGLISKNIKGIIPYVDTVLTLDYCSDEDYVTEQTYLSQIILENYKQWVNILLNEGFDALIDTINAQRSIMIMSYAVRSIRICDGNLVSKVSDPDCDVLIQTINKIIANK